MDSTACYLTGFERLQSLKLGAFTDVVAFLVNRVRTETEGELGWRLSQHLSLSFETMAFYLAEIVCFLALKTHSSAI